MPAPDLHTRAARFFPPFRPAMRKKVGVKRPVLTKGQDVPVGVAVDEANCHDMKPVRVTIEGTVVARPEPTLEQPQGMCLDKCHDYDETRATLCTFGFTAHIRNRGEETKEISGKAGGCTQHWVVEGSHSWLNRFHCCPDYGRTSV